MKRVFQLIVALLFALLALILAVSSCAPQPGAPAPAAETAEPGAQPEEEPAAPEADAVIQPEEQPEVAEAPEEDAAPGNEADTAPAGETLSMADMTPAERAAVWGLPEPPEDIDLSLQQFKLANSYNSITEQRPNHSYGAGVTVDKVAAEAFNNFVAAAHEAGYGVTAFRGYIDYWTVLENYYEPVVYAYGAEVAGSTTYVPGCNDHQTALCIDLRLGGTGNTGEGIDFRGTEAWDWILANCADYGIILRYPEGQERWYGTACMNPCHFRYVGEDAAHYIMDNNITLEQFMLLYDWERIYVPGIN